MLNLRISAQRPIPWRVLRLLDTIQEADRIVAGELLRLVTAGGVIAATTQLLLSLRCAASLNISFAACIPDFTSSRRGRLLE